MNGIDIASYQSGINLKKVPCDFVIIKATQGTGYINPDFDRAFHQAKEAKKKVGIYHYASKGGSSAEAKFFVDTVKSIAGLGEAILVLDWEAGDNVNWGHVSYAKAFLDYVKARTGVSPVIYMSKEVTREYNWSNVSPYYPLWRAQYKNYTEGGYQDEPWTDKYPDGSWGSGPIIFQYTSRGVLPNWRGHLDLNKAYITPDVWDELASVGSKAVYSKPVTNSDVPIDTSTYPVTKFGHKNAWVRLLQNALTVRGFECSADGVFGKKTKEQVQRFQWAAGLTMDGIVGPMTWKALFS